MNTKQPRNMYSLFQRFADVTRYFILKGKLSRVERCFNVANKLFVTGNFVVKNAISNVYLFSLSTILDKRDSTSKAVLSILPFELRKEYENQINSLGV